MKIIKIIVDSEDNILGLGEDNNMYIWNAHSGMWDFLLFKK
jgi:hypothetical protein